MAVSSLREFDVPTETLREICEKIARIPSFRGKKWDVTSPDVIEQVMFIINESLGDHDPFRDIRKKQNSAVLMLKEGFVKDLKQSSNPFGRALHLAVLGNMIDLMLAERPADLEKTFYSKLQSPPPDSILDSIVERLEKADRIIYLGDNCGEIILDGIFMDLLIERFGLEITLIVRSIPVMNDVTMHDAQNAELPGDVKVVENGIMGPYPGTSLNRCSPEVQSLLHDADLILSKGGGNFDSFGEEKEAMIQKTIFLLLSKCRPYCVLFRANTLDPVLTTLSH
jgi:uncharacterized protein with ATP-grasp and redox domains